MATIEMKTNFEPNSLKAFMKNELRMKVNFKNTDREHTYWCESDIVAKAPLSLAHDMPLETGRIRVGILKPGTEIIKTVNLYTLPNNFPDDYKIKFTVYLYDDEGAIHERVEETSSIECRGNYPGTKEGASTSANVKS
ncbi:MAG: hypothetical protein M1465_02640 [Candidatus Marsarchaeota archaeon]|nr:hypothetical protein [Candidatus Marsarchaeota archaeon]